LSVGVIEAGLGCEVVDPSSPVAAAEVGVRRVPVPGPRDRGRGPLVPAVQPVYRDVQELLVERGVEVDHVTVYRWVQRFTPLLADAARFCLHSPGDRWHVDETYVKVNGVWRYVYRAVDQYGQVIDLFVSRATTPTRPGDSSDERYRR
jgi:hypothetical protein